MKQSKRPLPREDGELRTKLDRTKLVQDTLDLVNVDSPTGREGQVGELYAQKLKELGMKVVMQEVESGRSNIVATLRGKDSYAATLMFNGHLDTSFAASENPEILNAISNVYPNEPPWGRVKKDWLTGMGSFNMKGALAAYAAAVRTIQDRGISLLGDIVICGVIGEIEKAQVDRYIGPNDRGYGHGTAYLVSHGGTADCAILGEPTGLRLMRTHSGSCWFKIGLRGTLVHTGHAAKTPNTILQMNRIISAIENWIPSYQERFAFRGVKPTVNVGSIEGGWPWRASRTPHFCNLYVDVRFPPRFHPLDVKQEIAGVLREVSTRENGISPDLEIYVTDEWSDVGEDEPISKSVAAAHKQVFRTKVEDVYYSWSSDANLLTRNGIAAVNYGPSGGEGKETRGTLYIPNLVRCAQVYAIVAVDICSKSRKEIHA
jgi:acetylornithine deacetylase/succinyl-diaminopimelate desuccinylase-like protein